MVGGVDDGVLEAAGVLEVQVQLAGLGAVGLHGAGADVGLEFVEAVGDNLRVVVNNQRGRGHGNCVFGRADGLAEVLVYRSVRALGGWQGAGCRCVMQESQGRLRSCRERWSWRRSLEGSHCRSRCCQ